jgi:hypothetical protein
MSAIEALRTITAQAIGAAQVVMTDKRKQLFGDAMRQLTVDVSAGRSHSVAMSLRPECRLRGKPRQVLCIPTD